ncbi:MAG: VOC family protein [Propionibacteriaceae bacterium]|jgi:predicted enzyme related to lactoylglutathione lyase|nr:VOC family protein [Propionibacteriaceae bacterium]
MNTITYFEIQSSDPEREAAFYHEIFGWEISSDDDTVSFPYYHVTTDGLAGGIVGRPLPSPPAPLGTNGFSCSVRVPDFDSTAARILELGGRVVLPKFAVEGIGWQGYFTDPDGNVFGVVQADESAVAGDEDRAIMADFSEHVLDLAKTGRGLTRTGEGLPGADADGGSPDADGG